MHIPSRTHERASGVLLRTKNIGPPAPAASTPCYWFLKLQSPLPLFQSCCLFVKIRYFMHINLQIRAFTHTNPHLKMLRYHQNLRPSLTLAYRIEARRSPCRGGGDGAKGRSCRGVNSVSPRSAGSRPAGRVRARGVVQRPTPLPGLSYGLVTWVTW